jgi:hypothetical protein
MAFSADELRVLRGALAVALQHASDPETSATPETAADTRVREYVDLVEAMDAAAGEAERLSAFLLADLARYRRALPGAAVGYLGRLEDALATGYLPRADDLAALRALAGHTAGEREQARRAALLRRCEHLAERAVRARMLLLAGGRRTTVRPAGRHPRPVAGRGARGAEKKPDDKPAKPDRKPGKPDEKPEEKPARRPVPTPGEVFPPRRKNPPRQVALFG